MIQPVSEPLHPAQPDAESYPVSALALFKSFSRDSYRAAFGLDAPAFDPSRPAKTWFDSTADVSRGSNVAVYRVAGPDGSIAQLVIPAGEAAAVNLPPEEWAGPVREMPVRGLLENERLVAGPEGVRVVRAGAGFTVADRELLRSVHAMVSRSVAPPAAVRSLLLPETAPLPVPVTKPAMPFRNSAEAYWAAQPAEVQGLRRIADRRERESKAWELAARGFTIDKRIMVWLWDPLTSMRVWKEAGYTWIPALGQPDIEVSPGLTMDGKRSYDPNSPPPGSIRVTTEFAEGYEY